MGLCAMSHHVTDCAHQVWCLMGIIRIVIFKYFSMRKTDKNARVVSHLRVLYSALRVFSLLVFPVLLSGAMFVVYVYAAWRVEDARVVAKACLMLGAIYAVLGWMCYRTLNWMISSGHLTVALKDEARRRSKSCHLRLMIKDYECVERRAMLEFRGRPVLLVVTDRRLILVTYNLIGSRVELVTECDRLAVKSVVSRDVPGHWFGWLWGETWKAAVLVELIGVGLPQRLVFRDPRQMVKIVSMLQKQEHSRPVKNGIRKIMYSKYRRALKLKYVKSFFEAEGRLSGTSVLLSVIYPGLGQIHQERLRVGLAYGGLFAALVMAQIVTVSTGQWYSTGTAMYQVIIAFLLWLLSVIDVYIHRQGANSLDYASGVRSA